MRLHWRYLLANHLSPREREGVQWCSLWRPLLLAAQGLKNRIMQSSFLITTSSVRPSFNTLTKGSIFHPKKRPILQAWPRFCQNPKSLGRTWLVARDFVWPFWQQSLADKKSMKKPPFLLIWNVLNGTTFVQHLFFVMSLSTVVVYALAVVPISK